MGGAVDVATAPDRAKTERGYRATAMKLGPRANSRQQKSQLMLMPAICVNCGTAKQVHRADDSIEGPIFAGLVARGHADLRSAWLSSSLGANASWSPPKPLSVLQSMVSSKRSLPC